MGILDIYSIYGIDVSEFQGNINWQKVKEQGIQFAILRAGYGTGSIDRQFRRNAEGCSRYKIPCGVYWFSYAYTPEMARQEAESCIETIEEYEISYPVCIDYEYSSMRYGTSRGANITRRLVSRIVEEFCSRVEELGYRAMYYSDEELSYQYFEPFLKEKYALWFSKNISAPDASGQTICKYRDDGMVDGISGNVGMDLTYHDFTESISSA